MKKPIILLLAATALLLLLFAEQTSGSFFSSLQFTRESLMGFSRGSERTVDILTPKKTTETVSMETVATTAKETEIKSFPKFHRKWSTSVESKFHRPTAKKTKIKSFPKFHRKWSTSVESKFHRPTATVPWVPPPTELIPITKTVVTYENKRKVYRQRSSPSNKFLEALNDIERAVVNAKASGIRYSDRTLARLKALVERALRGKSYKYARQVLGQIMYLLSAKPVSPGRRKRSSTNNEGNKFLRGLRQRVGSATFDSFMAVQGDVSLMFVIDDTGSMSDEIQAAKNIAIDIINYPREAPIVTYILSPFNDPYPDTPPVVSKEESEAGDFVAEINKLRAHGGGDCPEYTFRGMKEALYQDPAWGSPMYVFTDADPKDASEFDIEEVKTLAGVDEYGVTINFFTTGYCGSRGGRGTANLHPAFRELAEFTSGQAVLLKNDWELEQLNNLTGGVMEGTSVVSIGSNVSGRKKRSAGDDSRYSIPVDDSMEKMTVTVTTTRRETKGRGITLKDPDNVIITSGKLSLSQISVFEISNPRRGAWTLTVSGSNGGHEFSVKSSSATNVDFEYYFLIKLPGRRRQPVEVPNSNPVIGKSNELIITLAGSEKVDTSSLRLQLITTEGNRIRDVTLRLHSDRVHFTASITPDSSMRSFKLKLKGTTQGGNPFERISHQTIKPTTAVLRTKYASNDYTLPLNRRTFIHFQLCNFGNTENFNVTVVKDRLRYVVSPRLGLRRVIKGRCVTIPVFAKATRPQDVETTDSVFVIAKGNISRVVVSKAVRLFVVS